VTMFKNHFSPYAVCLIRIESERAAHNQCQRQPSSEDLAASLTERTIDRKRGFSFKHLRSFAASSHSSGIFIQPGESFSNERYYREDRDICRFDSGAQR